MPPRRKLGRLGLIVWLVTPIAIVAAMWFLIDRSQGVPRAGRKMGSPQTAPTAADAKPISTQPARQ